MEPIIKWAGGKRQLLTELKIRMPSRINTYSEPFIGSGALLFDVCPDKAVIGDTNKELINMYKMVRDRKSELKEVLSVLEDTYNALEDLDSKCDLFYAERNVFNKCISEEIYGVKSAALMIFLNKTCFNGMYRVNTAGLYNVPFGKHKTINLIQGNRFDEMSEALAKMEIFCADYEITCKNLDQGDFVYFDSPYYDTFDTYQAGGFSEKEHKRLANYFEILTRKGVNCMLSNSNTDFIRELYQGYKIEVVNVKRSINRNGNKRTGTELIITNYN